MSHYDVEGHDVAVWERRQRWTTSVDHVPVPGWFLTEAEAWAAGVQQAYRDAARPSTARPSGRARAGPLDRLEVTR